MIKHLGLVTIPIALLNSILRVPFSLGLQHWLLKLVVAFYNVVLELTLDVCSLNARNLGSFCLVHLFFGHVCLTHLKLIECLSPLLSHLFHHHALRELTLRQLADLRLWNALVKQGLLSLKQFISSTDVGFWVLTDTFLGVLGDMAAIQVHASPLPSALSLILQHLYFVSNAPNLIFDGTQKYSILDGLLLLLMHVLRIVLILLVVVHGLRLCQIYHVLTTSGSSHAKI